MSDKRKSTSSDSDTSGEYSTPRKKINYEHKFQLKWLLDSRFSSWICRSKYSENKAFCKVCNCEIAGSVTLLQRHSKTEKHVRNMKRRDKSEVTSTSFQASGSSHFAVLKELPVQRPGLEIGQLQHQTQTLVPAANGAATVYLLLPRSVSQDTHGQDPDFGGTDTTMSVVCEVQAEASVAAAGYDGIVLVTDSLEKLQEQYSPLQAPLKEQASFDESVLKDGACVKVDLPAARLVFSPTGPLDRDQDDVRRFADAAAAGIKRALKVGIRRPLLVRAPDETFPQADLVTLLGALHALYVPLEIREDVPKKASKASVLGFVGSSNTVQLALALESGRLVARDIGGSDPERMAAPRVEEYVRKVFGGSNVSVEVVSEDATLCKEFPLFSAVNRCAKGVPRHQGRVIHLTYEGSGPVDCTLMLVGKGVTYDTGGADIKAGGVMAGMHRDKCGSAAVAGFMQVLNKLQPPNLKVIGSMTMVRNSVGSECYVSDEIITSRAGVRIRVGNTDAEGRMAMADVLCLMKEKALKEVNPHLMTIATLTGHCLLAYGTSYSAIMDNGPANQASVACTVQAAGDELAEPLEISTIRREDYEFHAGKSEYEDVLQSNTKPSSQTPRGHQSPSAFLVLASGLDKHGKDSKQPLKYSHLDIAGSSGPFPGIPTGAPILALARAFISSAF